MEKRQDVIDRAEAKERVAEVFAARDQGDTSEKPQSKEGRLKAAPLRRSTVGFYIGEHVEVKGHQFEVVKIKSKELKLRLATVRTA